MARIIYLIRHCRATGQAPDALLTDEGLEQAEILASELSDFPIRRIVSSPYCRACQSAMPLARRLKLVVEVDPRLVERTLCDPEVPRPGEGCEARLGVHLPAPLLQRGVYEAGVPDWEEKLRESFADLDLTLPGGESSRTAMRRGVAVVEECLGCDEDGAVAIVTHGNLLALILKHFDDRVGFADWKALRNPDVWRMSFDGSKNPAICRL